MASKSFAGECKEKLENALDVVFSGYRSDKRNARRASLASFTKQATNIILASYADEFAIGQDNPFTAVLVDQTREVLSIIRVVDIMKYPQRVARSRQFARTSFWIRGFHRETFDLN